jgi:CBS domain-containing protein
MALLLGTKGNDILSWRASAELVTTLKGVFATRWADSSAHDAESFLESYIDALREELAYEAQFLRESSALDEAIGAAGGIKELKPMRARYRDLISAHFRRRQSVLALCEACSRLHDGLLSRILLLVRERLQQTGHLEVPPHAVLVSGDRGRQEETLHGENRYFLLLEKDAPSALPFARELSAALHQIGLLNETRTLWHGTPGEWRSLLEESFSRGDKDGQEKPLPPLAPLAPFAAPLKQGPQEIPEWEWRFEALADLTLATGDAALGAEALSAAATTLQLERNGGPFLQLSRRVIALPLAIGHFGRWRLQRKGEHRGELNLEELALSPLTMAIRVLALHIGIHAEGTVERVKALLEKGALDVELAERLLKAYQCFMRLKILSEIRSEESGSFCSPEEFDDAEESSFKAALEALSNLQKIAYQRMVLQG